IMTEVVDDLCNGRFLVVAGHEDGNLLPDKAEIFLIHGFTRRFRLTGSWNGGRENLSILTMLQNKSAVNQARIIVPLRNGGARWREAADALRAAVTDPSLVVVVDSGSTDGSDRVAVASGFEVERIDPRTFNHGRTRQR